MYSEILNKIKIRSAKICIIWSGYVELLITIIFAENSLNLMGFTRNGKKRENIIGDILAIGALNLNSSTVRSVNV